MVDAFSFFTNAGWSPVQAAGIVGNLYHESGGLNPSAVGDGGTAYGLAQWHPDRQAQFQQVMGVPIQQSTATQQLSFVNWELNNTESSAGNRLRGQTTLAGATSTFMNSYERPANSSSLGSRLAAGAKALAGGSSLVDTGKQLLGAGITGALDTIPGGSLISGALGGVGLIPGQDSWFEQFQNWIKNGQFFQRLGLASLALIIFLAAFYLIKRD